MGQKKIWLGIKCTQTFDLPYWEQIVITQICHLLKSLQYCSYTFMQFLWAVFNMTCNYGSTQKHIPKMYVKKSNLLLCISKMIL